MKLLDLLDYNLYANKEALKSLDLYFENVPEKCILLMNHIINAHQIWNARINRSIEFEVWQINNYNNLYNLNDSNHNATVQILANRIEHDVVEYHNTKGVLFKNSIKDIVFHIINHSNYHRAQIAQILSQNGLQPPVTDFIFYKRNRDFHID